MIAAVLENIMLNNKNNNLLNGDLNQFIELQTFSRCGEDLSQFEAY